MRYQVAFKLFLFVVAFTLLAALCNLIPALSTSPTRPPTRTPVPTPSSEVRLFWCEAMEFFRAEGNLIDSYNALENNQQPGGADPYDLAATRQLAIISGDLWEQAQQLPRPAPAREAADLILEYATTISNAMNALDEYAQTQNRSAFDAHTAAIQEGVSIRNQALDALDDLDEQYNHLLELMSCP